MQVSNDSYGSSRLPCPNTVLQGLSHRNIESQTVNDGDGSRQQYAVAICIGVWVNILIAMCTAMCRHISVEMY